MKGKQTTLATLHLNVDVYSHCKHFFGHYLKVVTYMTENNNYYFTSIILLAQLLLSFFIYHYFLRIIL